jgi:signal transduction histidine kinase
MPSVFDPFRRGHRTSRSAKASGLGLGLYISREIVRAHGGQIDLRSVAGEGTTFEVTLPRRMAGAADLPLSPSGTGHGPSSDPRTS